MARVWRIEEKGSDVNLAVTALLDAFNNDYDCAALVTGDSDLKEAVRIIRNDLKKTVGVINPRPGKAADLQEHADFYKSIRKNVLAASQLPDRLEDSVGEITKPTTW